MIAQAWRARWEHIIPFLALPADLRRVVYTTNSIESLHRQIRKAIKTRGHFPDEQAATKLIYLAHHQSRRQMAERTAPGQPPAPPSRSTSETESPTNHSPRPHTQKVGQPPRDAGRPAAVEQRAARQLELGPEIVQMPLQRVVQRHALPNQALAMIDQQPQIQLGTVQLRRRQGVQAFAQRGARDRERVDAVGLAASRPLRRTPPSASSGPADPLAAADQKPLEGPRDVPAVLHRPDPLAAQAARPRNSAANPRRPTWTVRSPSISPVVGRDRGDRVRALVRVRAEHDHDPRPLSTSTGGHPADTACWGRCHAPDLFGCTHAVEVCSLSVRGR